MRRFNMGEKHEFFIMDRREFEAYKIALDMACEALSEGYGQECGLFKGKICDECDEEDSKVACLCAHLTPTYFLQKARGEV